MHRSAGLVALLLALSLTSVSPAAAQVPPDDPARGLRYQGLRTAAAGPCAGVFEIRLPGGRTACTHGPDPAPAGVDVRTSRPPRPATRPEGSTATEPAPTLCVGDGTAGARVQLVYARAESKPDRYDTYAASFQGWARALDEAVSASAAKTGGSRRLRFVHDDTCQPVVGRVVVPDAALNDFNAMVAGLHAAGHDRGDRKYLVWMDANHYCGLGSMLRDDRPGAVNGHDNGPPLYARIDSGCWGLPGIEAHELIHTMGGVQPTAPHGTPGYHCTDDYDVMCYPDGPGLTMTYDCPPSHATRLDCNADDYFSTAPAPGSYLETHWNVAGSRFLARPPGPPTGLQAIAGEGAASLSWGAPAPGDPPLTGYQVTTVVNGTPGPPAVLPPGTTDYVATGLENGTPYRFVVTAHNAVGPSAPAPSDPIVPSGDRATTRSARPASSTPGPATALLPNGSRPGVRSTSRWRGAAACPRRACPPSSST